MLRLIAVVTLALSASAQTRYPNEMHAAFGGGWTYDDEGSIGTGTDFVANIGRRLTSKLAVEADLNYFRHKRELSFATWKGTGAFITGNLLYHFTRGRVQPYVLAGFGMLAYDPDFTTASESSTSWAWGFGFGIKGWITERVSIRPEWRVYLGRPDTPTGFEAPISHSRITVGIGYRW